MATFEGSTFGFAISRLLDSWTALQLAVEQGFGGAESQEKALWMVYAIETWFRENANIEPFEVEDFLEDVCNTEFDLIVEDNSLKQISELLCLYYRLCQENKVDELNQRLQSLPKASVLNCRKQKENQKIDDLTGATSSSTNSSNIGSSSNQASTSCAEDIEMSEDQPNPDDTHLADQPLLEDGWQVIQRSKKKK